MGFPPHPRGWFSIIVYRMWQLYEEKLKWRDYRPLRLPCQRRRRCRGRCSIRQRLTGSLSTGGWPSCTQQGAAESGWLLPDAGGLSATAAAGIRPQEKAGCSGNCN